MQISFEKGRGGVARILKSLEPPEKNKEKIVSWQCSLTILHSRFSEYPLLVAATPRCFPVSAGAAETTTCSLSLTHLQSTGQCGRRHRMLCTMLAIKRFRNGRHHT